MKARLHDLILFELLSILLLCAGIGATLFVKDLSTYWRERYSRDSGVIEQAFLDHRNEILNGVNKGFEANLTSAAKLYGIRNFEIDYKVTGKTVRVFRDARDRKTLRTSAPLPCHGPTFRTSLTGGANTCFATEFNWDDRGQSSQDSVVAVRWWALPEDLGTHTRAALLTFASTLILGLAFCALHWLLIRNVIVKPISDAVGRFDQWVRNEKSSIAPLSPFKGKTGEISDLIEHFDQLLTVAEDYRNMRELAIQLEAVEQVADQVTHDLRSPLSALRLAYDRITLNSSDEAKALVQSAFQRVHDILATLARKGKVFPVQPSDTRDSGSERAEARAENVAFLLEPIIAEHRLQVEGREISIDLECPEHREYFVRVNGVEIRRALSNLLTNAVEALPDHHGKIRVTVQENEAQKRLSVSISDDGVGMPEHILRALGQKGVTHGKEQLPDSGSGLGVYQAIRAVESCAGHIHYSSRQGRGTTVALDFPLVHAPRYWAESLPNAPVIVVVDDDIHMHRIWREVYRRTSCKLVFFLSATEFEEWHERGNFGAQRASLAYLFDFSLGRHQPTGFDLVLRNRMPSSQVYVVTGVAQSEDVQLQAERLQVKLLHKRYVLHKKLALPSTVHERLSKNKPPTVSI